jgi:diadenosine tetraphosphate (Ap4A) HIT family hydrolase
MTSTLHCDFCDEFSGGFGNAFRERYGNSVQNREVISTEGLRVFASIGQIVEGYLLIAPKAHYTALDQMPSQLLQELSAIFASLKSTVSAEFGPSLCFEHGAREPLNGGCGIYHAHLHLVPFERAHDPVAKLKTRFPYEQVCHFQDIAKVTGRSSPYLLYEDTESNKYVFLADNLPSQYVRRLLAEVLGQTNWDWRTAGREERLLNTLNRLSHRFDSSSTSLGPQKVHHETS